MLSLFNVMINRVIKVVKPFTIDICIRIDAAYVEDDSALRGAPVVFVFLSREEELELPKVLVASFS